MASQIRHLRSGDADKRPAPEEMVYGQLAVNYSADSRAVFFKDSADGVTKVGPTHVGPTAPNLTPAGSAGNSVGESWLDTSDPAALILKIWDGAQWSSAAGVVGPQGPAGADGAPGADSTVPGPQGPAGADSVVPGPEGPAGPAGADGAPGADSTVPGPQGPAGPTAVSADVGNTSVLGTDGLIFTPSVGGGIGPEGPPGPAGPAGPAGADSTVPGPAGPAGADSTVPGPKGDPGADGAPGADSTVPGPAGPAGADSVVPGPQGPAGVDGAAGPPGPTAVSTEAGNASRLGTDGLIFTPASGGSQWTDIGGALVPTAGGGVAVNSSSKFILGHDAFGGAQIYYDAAEGHLKLSPRQTFHTVLPNGYLGIGGVPQAPIHFALDAYSLDEGGARFTVSGYGAEHGGGNESGIGGYGYIDVLNGAAPVRELTINPNKGQFNVRLLSGTGTEMVVADDAGNLTRQPIGSGPQGPQGPAGADGAPGPAGADSTVPGPQGPAGADSTVPGPAGADGAPGPAGADSVVPGPAGPAGPTAVSTDAGNTSTLGTDGLIYTPGVNAGLFVPQDSPTGAAFMPAGPAAARPGAPAGGWQRFHTDSGRPEYFDGATWQFFTDLQDIDKVFINTYSISVNGLLAFDIPSGSTAESLPITYLDIPAGNTNFYVVGTFNVYCAYSTLGQPPCQPYAFLTMGAAPAPSKDVLLGFQASTFTSGSNMIGDARSLNVSAGVSGWDSNIPASFTINAVKLPGGGQLQIYDAFVTVLAWSTVTA